MTKIKSIIFDMDGVLVDARELHYHALNDALLRFSGSVRISRVEHLSTYDGRPTKEKLNLLTQEKGLPTSMHDYIWRWKQEATIELARQMLPDIQMIHLLKDLKENLNLRLFCASNSIRETTKMMLLKCGLLEHLEDFISNEDVHNPKPHPEMYMRLMVKFGLNPKETLIVEDSHIGREAAINSGAHLLGVKDPSSVTYNAIHARINELQAEEQSQIKWQGGKMNVLIPMAGAGSRFEKAGYTFPKPLIEVEGKPMIQLVVENLNIDAKHIFLVQKEHYEKYNLKYLLNLIAPNCKIVQVDGVTEGAACTTLLAKEFINNDEPLLIANSDQFVDWNSNKFMYSMEADQVDAGILTFTNCHPKWSYAKLGEDGFVSEVAEKKPISNKATVGIYYFTKGSDYVKYAEQMIAKNIRTNNEFYVCPVFNEMVQDDKKVKIFDIERMWGLGTPEDLERYLKRKEK